MPAIKHHYVQWWTVPSDRKRLARQFSFEVEDANV